MLSMLFVSALADLILVLIIIINPNNQMTHYEQTLGESGKKKLLF